MAAPTTNLEIWAEDSLNLPVTNKPNKQRPIDDLWSKGYDRGQKPACEEYNYVLNMLCAWTKYILDEGLPQYLPITGTSAVLSGDLSGTITWNGSAIGTGDIEVLDNSHEHLSANISDATVTPTPDVIPVRGSDGHLEASRSYFGYAPTGNNFDYWFMDAVTNAVKGSISWGRTNNSVNMYVGVPGGNLAGVYCYGNDGYVGITRPRTLNGQETQANSLVRYDYLTQQISSVQTTAAATYVQDIRLAGRTTIRVGGTMVVFPDGCVGTSACGDSDSDINAQYAAVQKNINGSWYTVSG